MSPSTRAGRLTLRYVLPCLCRRPVSLVRVRPPLMCRGANVLTGLASWDGGRQCKRPRTIPDRINTDIGEMVTQTWYLLRCLRCRGNRLLGAPRYCTRPKYRWFQWTWRYLGAVPDANGKPCTTSQNERAGRWRILEITAPEVRTESSADRVIRTIIENVGPAKVLLIWKLKIQFPASVRLRSVQP